MNSFYAVILFFLFCVNGLSIGIISTRGKPSFNVFLLSPFVGFGLILSVSTVWLGIDLQLTSLIKTLSVVTILSFVNLIFNRKIFCYTNANTVYVGIFISIIFVIMFGFFALNKNSNYDIRLGVDIGLYLDAARALIEGNKINAPTEFSGAAFYTHLRWGLPILIALTGKIFYINYLESLTVIYYLALVLLFFSSNALVITFTRFKFLYKALICFSISFNVNLLFLLTEGQIPSLIFSIFFWAFIVSKNVINTKKLHCMADYLTYLIPGLIFSVIIVTYSEGIPIVFVYIAVATVVLSILSAKINLKIPYALLPAVALSFIFVLPYSVLVIKHLLTLNVLSAGYNLPLVAFPNEIAGINSIFSRTSEWMLPPASVSVLRRGNYLVTVMLSAITITLFYKGLKSVNKDLRAHSLSAIILCFVGFFYFYLYKGGMYAFMKIYTVFVPVIVLAILNGLFNLTDIFKSQIFAKFFKCAIILFIFITSVSYVTDHKNTSLSIDGDDYSLNTMDFSDCVFVMNDRDYPSSNLRYVQRSYQIALSSFLKKSAILDQWENRLINAPNGLALNDKSKICLLIDRGLGEATNERSAVLFSNKKWMALSTNFNYLDYKLKFNGEPTKLINYVLK